MEAVLYPFERFTERAKKVLTLAQEEAERSHHSYIGTEHLLLGLLREGEGLAAKVLNNLGVEINKVRSTIESVLGRNERIIIQQIIPTSRVKKVIEISFEEARRMGNNYVGTEHLLLGLLIEGEGIAAHVLEDLGANLEKVRGEIDKLLHESGIDEESKEAQKKPSKTPLLDQFCRDLTDLAIKNSLDPVIGRAMEIERVVQILSRRTKNNPALIGEPGVGKTAIAEGLAQQIILGNIPESLMGKRVLTLDMGALVAGTKYRGEFEERLKKILDEIRASREVDPLHRRAAHAGRRRRRRGRDRRRQHPQARARAWRDPVHRRDDAQRVPQVHREGRGARAPFPAGVRRRAVARRDHRDPARHPSAVREAPSRDDHRRGAQGRSRAVGALRQRPLTAGQGHRPHR